MSSAMVREEMPGGRPEKGVRKGLVFWMTWRVVSWEGSLWVGAVTMPTNCVAVISEELMFTESEARVVFEPDGLGDLGWVFI